MLANQHVFSAARHSIAFSWKLDGQGHHVHLDLGRFAGAVYTVAPSVCYGFRPSFELHLTRDRNDPGFALAFAVRDPWRGSTLARDRVVDYFRRVLAHRAQFGDVVQFRARTSARAQPAAWDSVYTCLLEAAGQTAHHSVGGGPDVLPQRSTSLHGRYSMAEPVLRMPGIVEIVRGALALRDASLVIYRRRTLIEFKTERLSGGLTLYEEDGHTSWQFGDFEDHHCHLDIGLITEVLFGAEPVSCQGGRLNYTVWFLADEDCGNPYRPRAYFSVTLNRPYTTAGEVRREVIEPVIALWHRFQGTPQVAAEPAFVTALESYAA